MRTFCRSLFLFVAFTLVMALSKVLFCLVNGGFGAGDILQSIWHGLSMDMSVAGYLTALPSLCSIALIWADSKRLRLVIKVWLCMESALVALALVSNTFLYKYWGFPLDTTPLFYIMTSPGAAMASLPGEMWLLAVLAVAVAAWGIYLLASASYFKWSDRIPSLPSSKWMNSLIGILSAAALFIPIRGGFTVSTMNLSRAYYCEDIRKNHAAVNPLFSFLHSVTLKNEYKGRFDFMPSDEAGRIVDSLYAGKSADSSGSEARILPFKPDIQYIILESFSSHLIPSLGGEGVAMRLDSIAREGLLFTDIYASSFRTDRALVAALCGWPAQPTASLIKYTDKIESLPSIAGELKKVGYEANYIYGGDINFTNMNTLLMANGFTDIIKDKDFPLSERLSKWGAHDDVLFARAWELAKARSGKGGAPRFTVIQTSSSHEPFDVPYRGRHSDERKNAFEFTDKMLGDYIDSLKTLPEFDRTLIVIVPDHYGAWPELDNHKARHRVPLVFAGGAARYIKATPEILGKTGSQTDIAATLLTLVGADATPFRYSSDLLNPARRGFAFFSEPSWIGMKCDGEYAELTVDTGLPVKGSPDSLVRMLKAYVQTLYTDIDAL